MVSASPHRAHTGVYDVHPDRVGDHLTSIAEVSNNAEGWQHFFGDWYIGHCY